MDCWSEKGIREGDLMELVRERLAAGFRVQSLTFRGVSMMPMLRQGKDSVDLAPVTGKLKKYDLPVYHAASGKYLMHRVVGFDGERYICLGDNTLNYEYIEPEQMIGVVTAFTRGHRKISVTDPAYRLYCRFWYLIFPVRRFARIAGYKIGRLLK